MRRLLTTALLLALLAGAAVLGIRMFRQDRPATGTTPTHSAATPVDDVRPDLRALSPVAAMALMHLEASILTAFDSAAAALSVPCDEGMSDRVLFAADGNILDVAAESQSQRVKVELTSVARADLITDGCDILDIALDEGVRTDTVDLLMERSHGTWKPYFVEVMLDGRHTPLAGRLDIDTTIDWTALFTRVDSIRRARNKPLLRPAVAATGHYDALLDGLAYPDHFNTPCPAAAGSAATGSLGEIAYVDDWQPGMFDQRGAWYAIWEPRPGRGQSCIAAVNVVGSKAQDRHCDADPGKRPVSWFLHADSTAEIPRLGKPQLYVRDIQGLRTGLQATPYSTVSVRGWDAGALIYDDRRELLRIVETPPEPSEGMRGFRLSVVRNGRAQPLLWVDEDRDRQSWGVFWVGHLNGDDVPDMILRVSKHREQFHEHKLRLVLSTSDAAGASWRLAPETTVLQCESGSVGG